MIALVSNRVALVRNAQAKNSKMDRPAQNIPMLSMANPARPRLVKTRVIPANIMQEVVMAIATKIDQKLMMIANSAIYRDMMMEIAAMSNGSQRGAPRISKTICQVAIFF